MQLDFHYYATYCAAWLAGYSYEECLDICYSAQFVDCCTETILAKIKGPMSAATTQLQLELMDYRKDIIGLQNITRIWTSFHFLPYDLHAKRKGCSRVYLNRYRLICNVNGSLLADTVNLAKGGSLQAVGIAMHVLADTWAHRYFAGTPSLVINNTDQYFYELIPQEGTTESIFGEDFEESFRKRYGGPFTEKKIRFQHNPSAEDDPEENIYVSTPVQFLEHSVMNLGHGRAGHLPDYSFVRYKYLPAWAGYREVVKDNPYDYMHAFCQMIYAMKYLRGEYETFEKSVYDTKAAAPWKDEIVQILEKRQPDASEEWKAFAEKLTGYRIEDFSEEKYQAEYVKADKKDKDDTFLGKFFLAAMEQKSMVTNKIFSSGNMLAGFSIDYSKQGFKGIRDYLKLVEKRMKEGNRG